MADKVEDKNIEDNKDNPTSDDSKNTDKGKSKAFDTTTLSDEEFDRFFDDPRAFKHERFKKLNESAKLGKEAQEKLAKLEEDRLKENEKWKELAEKKEAEANELKKQVQQKIIENKIQAEATKLGAINLEDVGKLIDRSKITIDESDNVVGADEAVKTLLESKPYLKGNSNQIEIGTGTNPKNNNQVNKFTLSQLQDPKFYQEHRDEIAIAYKTPGAIIDDLQQQ